MASKHLGSVHDTLKMVQTKGMLRWHQAALGAYVFFLVESFCRWYMGFIKSFLYTEFILFNAQTPISTHQGPFQTTCA